MPVGAFFGGRGKVRFRRDQAIAAAACLLIGGCAVAERTEIAAIYRDATGAGLTAREPPPGLDRPTPNLATVPPRPQRPEASFRFGLTEELESARTRAAEPLPPRANPAPPGADAPGEPPIPGAPPAPPRLVRAPPVPWSAAAGAAPAPAAERVEPGAVPALPPPDLLRR
jgi:hypothetical protein